MSWTRKVLESPGFDGTLRTCESVMKWAVAGGSVQPWAPRAQRPEVRHSAGPDAAAFSCSESLQGTGSCFPGVRPLAVSRFVHF